MEPWPPGNALKDGFRTLLLEKKKMPRDKCCSGMVMGEWGQNISERGVRRVSGRGAERDHLLAEATPCTCPERRFARWTSELRPPGEGFSTPGCVSARRKPVQRFGTPLR